MAGTVEVVGEAPSPSAPAEPSPTPEPARPDGPAEVAIVDFAFEPAALAVPVGTSVTFANEGQAPHSATARDRAWDTGVLSAGASEDVAFDAPGTYEYFCVVHPPMVGTIVVEEPGAVTIDGAGDLEGPGSPSPVP
jgi:plastocyanin